MSRRAAQASLALVAIVVGILTVGQLRSQAPALELSQLSARELSDLIDTLQVVNAQLSDALTDARDEVETYRERAVTGQSTLTLRQIQVVELAAFAGLMGVEGQGVVMRVEGQFEPANVNDIIHELRSAGAEAIAIDDIRITARSVAVRGAGVIEIDGVPLGSAFEVRAIGSPDGLTSALERPGGIVSVLRLSIGATFSIEPSADVTVPATRRDLAPQVAQPVE